ncbi:MAG: S-layer homology domain-containing protein [Oscillospiraceae bacterium]|nr:S-layer homology domain-containing protein [Oscillospiraceae bacterium]
MKSILRYPGKLLALTVACCILFTIVGPASVLAEDISGHWAADDIYFLMEKGIVQGDSNGNINPDNNITRAEFVAIINRALGFTETDSSNFPDVKSGAWYYDDFAIAKNEGYILGDDNGNANPDMPITRAEVAVIVERVLGLEAESATSEFADSESFPDWSANSIIALTEKGLINGYPDNTFRAYYNITRAEAFAILSRIIKSGLIPNPEEEIGDDETPQASPEVVNVNSNPGGGKPGSGNGNGNGNGNGDDGDGGDDDGDDGDDGDGTIPTELGITLAPGKELCSTIITFTGTKAIETEIDKYEFLIAPSISEDAVWTSIDPTDLIVGKEVVVSSVLHYLYLRVKASDSTPASEPTDGIQLTADNVNLTLNPMPQCWIDYDAETITVPEWYEYSSENDPSDYSGITGQPVSFLPGQCVYVRKRPPTDDLPFEDITSFNCQAPNRPDPPDDSAGTLSPGSSDGYVNIKLSPSLQFKVVRPYADADATGGDVIMDWENGDDETGVDVLAHEGCQVFYRFAAKYSGGHWSDNKEYWVWDSPAYKSLPSAGSPVVKCPKVDIIIVPPAPPDHGGGSAGWSNPFDDVSETDWFYIPVAYVNSTGLMNGTSANTFSPNETMSRDMAVMILYRMAGEPDVAVLANPYDDVEENHWYSDPVKWLANNGIIPGNSGNTFDPQGIITRQDLMVFLARYAEIFDLELQKIQDCPEFTDEADIADYAKESVALCVQAGIVNAYPDSRFNPVGQVTRAEFADFLLKFAMVIPSLVHGY